MESKLTGPFVLFAFALVLWSSAAGLSSYLGGAETRKMSGHPSVNRSQESEEIQKLRQKVEQDSSSLQARLELAGALHEEAFEKRDNNMLMDAVKAYQDVLTLERDNRDALLGLANLCFEASILDKAMEYFEHYLQLVPDDFKAKTDFALAKIQAGELEGAEKVLAEVVDSKPDLYQAHLALALAWKLEGKKEAAEKKAEEAKKMAPSEEDRERIDMFLKAMSEQMNTPKPANDKGGAEGTPKADLSPAGQVLAFFQGHPIVGPKLKGISWPELKVAQVALENFPVDQMPPFAREKFITGVKESLKSLPEKTEIRLIDSQTRNDLLVIEVGGALQ